MSVRNICRFSFVHGIEPDTMFDGMIENVMIHIFSLIMSQSKNTEF